MIFFFLSFRLGSNEKMLISTKKLNIINLPKYNLNMYIINNSRRLEKLAVTMENYDEDDYEEYDDDDPEAVQDPELIDGEGDEDE